MCIRDRGIREGMTPNGKNGDENDGNEKNGDDESSAGDKKRKNKQNASKSDSTTDIAMEVITHQMEEAEAESPKPKPKPKPASTSETKPKQKNGPSGFSNLNDSPDLTGSGAKIDYAGTVERAFDNLEKILGSDGIKKMSNDTARLADKQESLVSAMKNMQPLMQNAQKMLKSLEGTPFAGMVGAGGLLGDKKKE